MNYKVTEEIINSIKLEYPSVPLIKYSPRPNFELIYTTVKRHVLEEIQGAEEAYKNQGLMLPKEVSDKIVFDNCVLWPKFTKEQIEEFPVGLIPSITKSVMEKSWLIDVDVNGRALRPDSYSKIIKDFTYWDDYEATETKQLIEESPFAIFRVTIGRYIFVVRQLTRKDISLTQDVNDVELAIASMVSIWPKAIDWDNIPSGVVIKIVDTVSRLSGWEDEAEIMEIL